MIRNSSEACMLLKYRNGSGKEKRTA